MSKVALYLKMFAAGGILCIGGPALIYYVTPTEEELVKRYNPELRKRSLENRLEKKENFNNIVDKMKEHSRSNRPMWEAAAIDDAQIKANRAEEQRRVATEIQNRKDEIRKHAVGGG